MTSALLMAIAPVVSYSLQALGPVQEIATGHAHLAAGDPSGHHHDQAGSAPAGAAITERDAHRHHSHPNDHMATGHAAAGSVQDALSNPHAEHGAACDYCLIAARALAVVAALLWLLLAPASAGLRPTGAALHRPARQPWPAHAARGPPLLA